MNTLHWTRLMIAAAGISLGAAAVVACSDDKTEPTPTTPHDSGTSNQVDSATPPNNDSGPIGNNDSGEPIDSALPDVGACATDAGSCNSCYTPQQDPVNGCSPATVNCVKFDNTRVPANAP